MKEFEGINLEPKEPFKKYGLIFWGGEELSQSLQFDNEEQCNKILKDIIEGKGVNLQYDFAKEVVTVFPHRVIKIKFTEEYTINLTNEIRRELELNNFKPEVTFPDGGYFTGLNKHHASLVGEEELK